MTDSQSSYPTAKIQEMLSYLFYRSNDGFHYGWKDHIPVFAILKNNLELLDIWIDIMNYRGSPTSTNHDQPPNHDHDGPYDPDACPICGSGHSCDCNPHDELVKVESEGPHSHNDNTPQHNDYDLYYRKKYHTSTPTARSEQ